MTLVVLAAGLGSRFGGYKQVQGFGPDGQLLMEYSVFDAVRAGFDKVVFVIKAEMEETIERLCGSRLRGAGIGVFYAVQDMTSVPEFYALPEAREKPFGTVHALLVTQQYIDAPFAVVNADDYYGRGAYPQMAEALAAIEPEGQATMIAYRLKNTVSSFGEVTRGICETENGCLARVTETKRILLCENGEIRAMGSGELLEGESLVSMNLWGFTPGIFAPMRLYFESFLRSLPEGELTAECVLPVMVDSLIREGALEVSVLETEAEWFGVTYREDMPAVRQALSKLHAGGEYPDELDYKGE